HQRGETAGHNVPLARLAREHAERRVLRQPKIEADEALQRTEFRFLRRNAPCRRGLATRPFARFNLYRRRHFLPCVPLLSDNRAGFQPRANSLNSNFLRMGIGAKIRAVSDVGAADPISSCARGSASASPRCATTRKAPPPSASTSPARILCFLGTAPFLGMAGSIVPILIDRRGLWGLARRFLIDDIVPIAHKPSTPKA